MRIVQTVFGVFHHFELARQFIRLGHEPKIYSTWPRMRLSREGLPRERIETYPWIHTPEMLMHKIGFRNPYALDQISYANALMFDRWTSRELAKQPTPDVLVAISGSSLKTGSEIQARGGRVICDRGSTHQRFQATIVSEEYREWGIQRPVNDIRDIVREEKIYQMADAITVPSRFAARSFIEMGVPAEKLRVIPYGVRLEVFRQIGIPPAGRFEVLFAGAVSLRKGFPYLMEAFAKLKHPGKRLRVAGTMHPSMQGLLSRFPQAQVEYLGTVSQERLANLMSNSHLLVLPSIEEGLALVQAQALSCGCPVLASTNSGGEDLFTDQVEGFIVPVRDVNALYERMQLLADAPALQQKMSHAALLRVRTLAGWEDYGNRWDALLHEASCQNQLKDLA